jgi:transcriptional regulator with XRE-family HTH domain
MGFSQTEVAQKLNLKSSAIISRWEQGITQPSLNNALRLSALYKTLANELFWDLFTEYREELILNDKKHTNNGP